MTPSSKWSSVTAGDWSAWATRRSFPPSVEAACSPTGARLCLPITSTRFGASPTTGRPRPASLSAEVIRLPHQPTGHGAACKLSIPPLVADQVTRQYQQLTRQDESVAITTASAGTARAINVEIQRRRNPRRTGASVALADGTSVFVGDQVATRRNDAALTTDTGSSVRNRQTWTVNEVGNDGSLTLADPKRGRMQLPARYVGRHIELGWAVTGYGNQGVTTDHGICVVEPSSSRAGIYVAMTRGRGRNVAWIVDKTGQADAEAAFASAIARPANASTAHAVRRQLGGEVPEPVEDTPAQRMIRRLDQVQTPTAPARVLGR